MLESHMVKMLKHPRSKYIVNILEDIIEYSPKLNKVFNYIVLVE